MTTFGGALSAFLFAPVSALPVGVRTVPPKRVDAFALPAQAFSLASDQGVIRRVFMPVWAMSFVGVGSVSVASPVAHIGGVGVPAQIAQMVVERIIVLVARLKPRRARANERFQYQPMNCARPVVAAVGQHDNGDAMRGFAAATPLEDSPFHWPGSCPVAHHAVKGPDSSLVGNLIQSFPVDNREPFLSHSERLPQRAGRRASFLR